MTARVTVVPFAEYQAWYDRQAADDQARPRRGRASSAQRINKQQSTTQTP